MITLDQFGVETPDEAASDAVIVGDYRYLLWRRGNAEGPVLAFVALNPSTADATTDDDTVRKCIKYAERWDHGKLLIGNLFAYRTKHPSVLREQPADDRVGPENDAYLQQIANEADTVVAAWGVGGELQDRGREVYDRLDVDWHALGQTQDGHPWHPSRKANDLDPEPFAYGGDVGGE